VSFTATTLCVASQRVLFAAAAVVVVVVVYFDIDSVRKLWIHPHITSILIIVTNVLKENMFYLTL
jgi:hypothetical protein